MKDLSNATTDFIICGKIGCQKVRSNPFVNMHYCKVNKAAVFCIYKRSCKPCCNSIQPCCNSFIFIDAYLAHRSFDYALWTDEADAGTLEGLSSLYEKYLLYDRANETVNTGLSHHPDDINILAQQAKVQYLNGQFEEGLISNYRSLPKRQQPPVFIFGVLKVSIIDTLFESRSTL